MLVGKNYIELVARFGAFRAYTPEADFSFVYSFMRSRIPAECEIRREL